MVSMQNFTTASLQTMQGDNMSKTLYISDLDGTLMRQDQTISSYTVDTINRLVAKGMCFSFATARSLVTAGPITAGITVEIPAVVYNGAFIIDKQTGKILLSHYFASHEREEIFQVLQEANIHPIVYSYTEGVEKFTYCRDLCNEETRAFIDTKKGDVRDNPVREPDELKQGDIFYFTCIGEEEKLWLAYQRLKGKYICLYQTDIYSGAKWLEIIPKEATKANAVLQLKEMLGCDRIVAFGDAKNDIPLFQIADECYAVANAVPELKEVSTGVVLRNEEDGVARWLEENGSWQY